MDRIQSIDTFRALAIIAVISIHTTPFGGHESGLTYGYLDVLINQGSRFAVPLFFILSGFFFAKKIKKENLIIPIMKNNITRLFMIWLFFSVVYIFHFNLP